MKKKIMACILSLAMVFSVAACGKADEKKVDENAEIKEEIVRFVNDYLPSIVGDKESAVAKYNAYFEEGSNKDSAAWLDTLEKEAIVEYEVYVYNLKGIEVKSTEVSNLKDLYLQSAQSQYDAMADVISAIKNSDSTYLDSAQEKISQSEDYMNQYKTALKELCDTYGIVINGNLGATPSDAQEGM